MFQHSADASAAPLLQKRRQIALVQIVVAITAATAIAWLLNTDGVRLWWTERSSTTDLESAVRLKTDSPWPYYVLGIRYARTHRLTEASQQFEHARDAYPDSVEIRLALGKAYVFSGRAQSAVPELRRATELDRDNADAFRYLATAARLTRDETTALSAAKRATTLDAANPDGWYQYGMLFTPEQNNENDGRAFLKKAVDLSPKDGVYALAYGRSLADGAQFSDAIPYLRTAAKALPSDAIAHFFLGLCLHRGGKSGTDAPEAETELILANQLSPNDFKAHFELGIVLEDEGKFAQALPQYEIASKLDPGLGEIWFHLSRMADRAGQLAKADDARAHFMEIRKLHTEFTSLLHRLQANPTDSPTEIQLGQVLEKQGKPRDATTHYVQVLKREPNNAPARAALDQLCARMNWPKIPVEAATGE